MKHEIERVLGAIEPDPQNTDTPRIITETGYTQMGVPSAKSLSLVDQVAENEAFLTLLNTIDQARRRKGDILSILEDTNAFVLRHHRNVEKQLPRLSKPAQDHLQWLVANLDRTNSVLRTALNHLHTLYITTNRSKR